MRFLHEDYAPVAAWIEATAPTIHRLEWEREPIASGFPMFPFSVKRRQAHAPVEVASNEIEATFRRGFVPEQAGTVLSLYFHLNRPRSDTIVSLSGAVEHVEAFGADDEILIVGYHDGGVISVSRSRMAFQTGLDEAGWWGP